MKDEKRLNKGYKVKDSYYQKSMKRAGKENVYLATLVENVVIAYAYGLDIKAVKVHQGLGRATALDIFSEDFSVTVNEAIKNK